MTKMRTIGIKETTYQLLKERQLKLIAVLKETNISFDFVIQELIQRIHTLQTTQATQATQKKKPEYGTYRNKVKKAAP